jgi:hypothetical protein
MSEDEQVCLRRAEFLLQVQPGDWVVHINVPVWGQCAAAKVTTPYKFETAGNPMDDFRHTLGVDVGSLLTFDRNDPNVSPLISRRLKLQGHYWRIYYEAEFLQSLDNLKKNLVSLPGEVSHGLYFLRKDLKPCLSEIAALIQKNHPGKKLEDFLASIFKNLPQVKEVKINGSGWGTDFGADLLVTYASGLPISALRQDKILAVQVKSYTGLHTELEGVEQLKTAMKTFEAEAGLLITTARSSPVLEQKIEEAQAETGKPIALLAGEETAAFVLTYGAEQLFGILNYAHGEFIRPEQT